MPEGEVYKPSKEEIADAESGMDKVETEMSKMREAIQDGKLSEEFRQFTETKAHPEGGDGVSAYLLREKNETEGPEILKTKAGVSIRLRADYKEAGDEGPLRVSDRDGAGWYQFGLFKNQIKIGVMSIMDPYSPKSPYNEAEACIDIMGIQDQVEIGQPSTDRWTDVDNFNMPMIEKAGEAIDDMLADR